MDYFDYSVVLLITCCTYLFAVKTDHYNIVNELKIVSGIFLNNCWCSVPGNLGLSRHCPLQTVPFRFSSHRTCRHLSCWMQVYLETDQSYQNRFLKAIGSQIKSFNVITLF